MSNSGDPPPQSLIAQFDIANRLEDELPGRPAIPVVVSTDKGVGGVLVDDSLAGTLHLRVRAEANRNSVIQVRLRRRKLAANGGKSLYLQTRPGNFARLWPTNFDEEAGLDFGYWRSDDPEGPQWRLPDATVEFDSPLQTVAEEMERGSRFWEIDSVTKNPKPYIEPSHPLRYRFSPPTHLKVRPSWVDRRYHKNVSNLAAILDGARVESFQTELLYPIGLNFEDHGDRTGPRSGAR